MMLCHHMLTLSGTILFIGNCIIIDFRVGLQTVLFFTHDLATFELFFSVLFILCLLGSIFYNKACCNALCLLVDNCQFTAAA